MLLRNPFLRDIHLTKIEVIIYCIFDVYLKKENSYRRVDT